MKKILLQILLLCTAIFGVFALHAHAGNVLRVAAPVRPPFFFTLQGEPLGLETELLESIAESMRMELEFIPCRSGECLPLLHTGEADLATGVRDNPETAPHLLLVKTSYAQRPRTAFYRLPSTSPVRGYENLRGRKMGIVEHAPLFSQLEKDRLIPFIKQASAVRLFKLLVGESVELVAMDEAHADRIVRDMGLQKLVQKCTYAFDHEEPLHFAFSLGSRHLGRAGEFEKYLQEMEETGQAKEIQNRYLETN